MKQVDWGYRKLQNETGIYIRRVVFVFTHNWKLVLSGLMPSVIVFCTQ